jgi:cell division septum initiation protein DivIVA
MAETNKKPAVKNTAVENEFVDKDNGVESVPSALEIARVVGEAIASKLGNIKQADTTSAASIAAEIDRRAKAVADKQAAWANKIKNDTENYVDVMIPTIYKQFVPSMVVSINGCTVKIPADGKVRKVHKVYASEIENRLRQYDKKIQGMRENTNVQLIQGIM